MIVRRGVAPEEIERRMADPEKTAERDRGKTPAARADQRLAAALRENLRRRKTQQRGRQAAEDQRKLPE
jgi:hypothetical protein